MAIEARNPATDSSAGDSPGDMLQNTASYAVFLFLALVALALAVTGFDRASGIVMDKDKQPWEGW